MYLHITEHDQFVQIGWSAGHCPKCQQIQPARVEEVYHTVYLYGIEGNRTMDGICARCDICDTAMERMFSIASVDQWSPANGVDALRTILATREWPTIERKPELQLRSLLATARDDSAASKVSVTLGLALGAVTGGLIGPLLAFSFWEPVKAQVPLDQFGFIGAGVISGVLLGAVSGSLTQLLLTRRRIARERIARTVDAYQLDLVELEWLSAEYGAHIRSAVRQLRDRFPRK